MPELIPWSEMIRQMKATDDHGNGAPHDYEYVKADRKRKVAGEIATLRQVIVSGLKKTSTRVKHREKLMQTIAREGRDPNHSEHSTLNLYDPLLQKTTKVHLRLITKFNGKTVIY